MKHNAGKCAKPKPRDRPLVLRGVCSLELTVRTQPTNSGSDWLAVARICSCGPLQAPVPEMLYSRWIAFDQQNYINGIRELSLLDHAKSIQFAQAPG